MRIAINNLDQNNMYFVQLRTRDGARFSDWSRRFELMTTRDTVRPGPVTELSATMNEGNLAAYWKAPLLNEDGSVVDDLKDYEVTFDLVTPDPGFPPVKAYVTTQRAEFTKEANAAAFGKYRASVKITVRARDVMDNLSDPVVLVKTKAVPNPPTGLTWVSTKSDFHGTWVPPTHNVDGSEFTDPDGFDVKVIYATTNIRTYSVLSTSFDFTYEQNKAEFGGVTNKAKTPLTIEVRARDSVGQLSAAVTLTAGNKIPDAPTGVTGTPVADGIDLKWTPPADDDIVHYEIWSAPTSGGAGTLHATVPAPANRYTHQTVAYTQDHFMFVRAVDEYDSRSPESARTGAIRPGNPFAVDTVPPAASTLTTATPVRATTEQAAVTLTWTTPADTDLSGYQIRYSENVTPRVWQYLDVGDKTATSTTIANLRSQTVYVFQIRPYDNMINTPNWGAEVTGTSSKSTIIPSEITSSISILTGGTLRSADYVSGGTTGWLLQSSGLDINGGSVNARVVKAGALVSNVNVTHDGTTQPAWSLNLDGNASLNSVQVRGKIVVGSETNSGNVSIASNNYGGSGNQWAIKGDGTIDIKSYGAGQLQINSSGIYGYDSGGNNRIAFSSNGHFLLATDNGGLVIDNNGLRIYNGATNTVNLDRNGNATFSGTINSTAGSIGGWTINSDSLNNGALYMSTTYSMIYGGNGANRVGMRAGWGIWAGADWIDAGAPFQVNTAGRLTAKSGSIGGFEINGDSGLYAGNNGDRVMMQPGWGFWAGANSRDSSPFRVRADGHLTASFGAVGGWYLTDTKLYNGGIELNASTNTISGGTMRGTTIVASQLRTTDNGNRVQISDAQYDAVQWVDGNGWMQAELRGTMGETGTRGVYINSSVQVGNTQSIIYQVGKRQAIFPGGSVRLRARKERVYLSGNGYVYVSFGTVMTDTPEICLVQLGANSAGRHMVAQVESISNQGFALYVRYSDDGGQPGTGTWIDLMYYAEVLV